MELQEFKDKIKKEQEELELRCKAIMREYAISNNKIKIGDVIREDTGDVLKVEKIVVQLSYDKPYCVYKGYLLNKDGSIKKKKGSDIIHSSIIQPLLKQINGINV